MNPAEQPEAAPDSAVLGFASRALSATRLPASLKAVRVRSANLTDTGYSRGCRCPLPLTGFTILVALFVSLVTCGA